MRIPTKFLLSRNLSFTELYLNIFVNLIGQKESEKVSLSIDKESFFEIYEIN